MFKEKASKILKNKIIIAIIAILIPFIIEIIKFKKIELTTLTFIRIGFIYGIYILIGIYYLLKKFENTLNKLAKSIIKYRYQIAGIVLVIGVLARINLSSFSMWSSYVKEPDTKSNILGIARAIRSDEWLVQSPMMLSQAQNGYNIYNENIAQGSTNMLMVTAPVKDVLILAKPSLWGFLIFGAELGFSFYWMIKILAIILVSIEISLKITKKDNLLSLTGGLILALAPAMMWWFSSAIADGYIYGMGAVILFSYYMNNLDWNKWKKIGIAIGMLICIPSFALVLYPAFQVPFAFLMAVIMLNDFIPNAKKLKKSDYIIMGITIIGIMGLLIRYLMLCGQDMKIMMSTVYPGNRIAVGGDFSIERFIAYLTNIFLPYSKTSGNQCEQSSYIYSFMALIILIIYSVKNIKQNKKSVNTKLTISLVVLYIIFLIWEFIGFGEVLAKLTFMSMSPTPRTHVIVGIIGTLLTLIMMKNIDGKNIMTKAQAIIISLLDVAIAYVLIQNTDYKASFSFMNIEIVSVMLFVITYFLLRGNKKAWCYTMCIVAIIAGATINPICISISPITNTEISKEIKQINNENKDALWIGNSNITGQYLIANGVNCLNGVNSYPNFKWLKIVDPDEKYNEIYNRYAHIHVQLGDETNFTLLAEDSYLVTLTKENLKDLNIKYFYTDSKSSEETIQKFDLQEIYTNDNNSQYIYMIGGN